MSALASAIDNVYLAFADAPRPNTIAACPCCIDEGTLSRLKTLPLRQMTGEDLSDYAASAFLTAGDVEDYLYFLPRILEVSIVDETWWPTIEVTGRAIRETAPAEWPQQRTASVQNLFEAAFESFIVQKQFYQIDDWICGAAKADFNVETLLRIVATNEEAILEFFNSNAAALANGMLANEFWEPADSGQEEILAWLNSDKVRRVAFDAFGYSLEK